MRPRTARARWRLPADPYGSARAVTRRGWKIIALTGGLALAVVGVVAVTTASASSQGSIPAGAIRAADYSAQSGAQTESTGDVGGGRNVGWLSTGDWMRYDGIALGAAGTVATSIRIAAAYPDRSGSIQVRLDALTGPLLAEVPTSYTGSWQNWETRSATGSSPGGTHTVYLVMHSDQSMDFVNVNWFLFGTAPAGPTPSASATSPSAPTPPTATAAPPSTPPAGPPATGWVDVDQAAWQQELATFHGIAPLPIPAGTTMVSEFHTDCAVSGEAPDDPIVFPGMPGASHLHTFFGPSVNASTHPADLLAAPTNCNAPGDHAAYWVPTLKLNGVPVKIKSFRAYYGARVTDPSIVVPFPPGLVMVQGDPKRQVATPAGASGQFWCAGSAEIGRSADGNWPVCAPGGNLIYQLVFQDCWDGKHIDSPDHKSHMGPMQNGACTGAYPVAIPNLSLMVNYDSLGGDGLILSSGLASSMHGDFMNAWDPTKLSALVKICIDAHAKCGTTPSFTGG